MALKQQVNNGNLLELGSTRSMKSKAIPSGGDVDDPSPSPKRVRLSWKENSEPHTTTSLRPCGRRAASQQAREMIKLLSSGHTEEEEDTPVPRLKRGRCRKSTTSATEAEEDESYSPSRDEESESDKEEPTAKTKNGGRGSDAESGDDGLCEYERTRLRNIQDNLAFMASLNLVEAKESLKTVGKKKRTRAPRQKKEPLPLEPSRRSLRLQSIKPEGQHESPSPTPPEEVEESKTPTQLPPGPIVMGCDDDPERERDFRCDLVKSMTTPHQTASPSMPACGISGGAVSRAMTLSDLDLGCVGKVTGRRITALSFLPSSHKAVVVAGDLHGELGLWDVESGPAGVFTYHPHCGGVTDLAVPRSPASSPLVMTTSYDGTVRLGNFERGVFDLVYSLPEDSHVGVMSCDFSVECDWSVVSQSDGRIVILDLRSDRNPIKTWRGHQKTVKCVHLHPVANNILATSSNDGSVKIWDLRYASDDVPELCSISSSGRSVTSAYFSPLTGNQLLVTSLNNTIRIHHLVWREPTTLGGTLPGKLISHNTQTGRWLSPLRAKWDPTSDDCFTVGSMSIPRQIEVHTSGDFRAALRDPQLESVCSLTGVHPLRPLVAGGNSSGSVYVWGCEWAGLTV